MNKGTTIEMFVAGGTHPETSHIQMAVMSVDDDFRDYLVRLFLSSGVRGLTGKEVEPSVIESKRQGHNRQITALRRGKVLVRLPERRHGNVHIHRDHLADWIIGATTQDIVEYKNDDQW